MWWFYLFRSIKEVLKFLLAWESLCALAEVYLPLCVFKTRSASHCPFHSVMGQASLWFCDFFIAAEMMVSLVLRYCIQGLFPFLETANMASSLTACVCSDTASQRKSFLYVLAWKDGTVFDKRWNNCWRSWRVAWSTRALESMRAWAEVPDFCW